MPVAIALTWLTGADGGVQVEPLGRESNAWWRDVVVSGYPAMAWRPMEVPADTAAVGWHGRPLAEDSCPFRPIAPGPWSDALAPVLRTLPTGG
ncbi:MAG TPA: hypothetical protein VMH90_05780, partial [Thermoplasmata archaeon]|nr:hypothetical protein [Thermoplasmata archaeon]